MSYVAPAGNAILFNYVGGAYASPAGNAVVFDLAIAQGGGSGAITSWANLTITAYAPTYDITQPISATANINFNTQAVTTGTIQATRLTDVWGNITFTGVPPQKFVISKILGTNAGIVITPYTPTTFNGKITVAGTNAGIVITPYAATGFFVIRKGFDLPYSIWHTTLDVSAGISFNPQSVGGGILVAKDFEFPYLLSNTELPIKIAWDFPWGFRDAWAWEATYGLASLLEKSFELDYDIDTTDPVVKAWDLVYGTSLNLSWEFPYSLTGPVAFREAWGLQYNMRDFLRIDWGLAYELTEPVAAGFGLDYHIHGYDLVSLGFRFVYSIGGTTVIVQTNEPFITYQGRNLRIVQGDISASEGGYTWEGNFTLADIGDYVQFRQDETFTVNLYGEVWTFIVDGKELTRNSPAEITARLIGVSPSARFTSPRAIEQDYLWDTTATALDVVQTVTASDIAWNTVNWQVPGFRLAFDNAPGIDVVKALADAAGAVVESSKAGQLRVRPKYPISVPDYNAAVADQVYIESTDILTVSETYAIGEIYNKFRIGDVDLAQNDGIEWVPDYNGGLTGYLRVFPFPFRTDVNLIHTGDGTVYIGPQEVAYQEYDEIIEVFQGQGSVQYPIFVLLDTEFFGANLGSVVITPDVREFTVSGPLLNSVIRIRYRTRFLRYRSTSGSGRPTQFLLESLPLP
jgi:hypothetical protein